ncbi:MAG: pilin [Desulfobacteraceae bacterium]|nr:pilin [Desulfobacteraceae bacterium]
MKVNTRGFTLIELMIVLSIIGILATMAVPSFQDRVIRAQVEEALALSKMAEEEIQAYYKVRGILPKDNAAVGLPAPQIIVGNYVTAVAVQDGAVHVTLGNRVNRHAAGKTISIRPAVVEQSTKIPIAWVRGLAPVPNGMAARGENRTDLLPRHLPLSCRY